MSISSYASDRSAASNPHSCEFPQSNPSRQSGMVQPVVNEMFATVHAAGSSLLGLFTSCTTFDSTQHAARRDGIAELTACAQDAYGHGRLYVRKRWGGRDRLAIGCLARVCLSPFLRVGRSAARRKRKRAANSGRLGIAGQAAQARGRGVRMCTGSGTALPAGASKQRQVF
eukprot:scaffold10667_cov132-Isochrysis_galbana.AAC.4